MTIAAGTIVQAAYYCRVAGKQNCINVMHYRTETVINDPDTLENVAAALSTRASAAYRSLLEVVNSYDGLKLRIPGPAGTAALIARNGAGAGSALGNGMAPTQLCVVASLRSATAPPRVRGRQYFGGFTKDDMDSSGDPSAALLTRVNSLLDATALNPIPLILPNNTVNLVPVIYRRVSNLAHPITSRVVRTNFGTQRRRSEINRGDQAL
jgi:hypothetical protein